MNRFIKILASATIVVLGLSVMTVCFAAGQDPSFPPENQNVVSVNITEEQAVKIALKAYPGSELISVKLYETAYTVRISTFNGKRYIKIGAMSGRILEDYPIDAQGKILRTSK